MLTRVAVFFFAFSLVASAFASVSLSTGAVLPGWEQIRSGPLVDQAEDIIRNYSLQVPEVTCALRDVHIKENASLISRSIHVDTWLQSQGELTEVLTDLDQHVLLLEPNFGLGNHLIVVFQLDRDLLLVAC